MLSLLVVSNFNTLGFGGGGGGTDKSLHFNYWIREFRISSVLTWSSLIVVPDTSMLVSSTYNNILLLVLCTDGKSWIYIRGTTRDPGSSPVTLHIQLFPNWTVFPLPLLNSSTLFFFSIFQIIVNEGLCIVNVFIAACFACPWYYCNKMLLEPF
jgi:hypothetical protein